MWIDARRDVIDVRVGRTFGKKDVDRIHDAVEGLGAFSRLTIDFAEVRECDDAALVLLASLLRGGAGQVALRGLSHHQWRLLTYVGLGPLPRAAHAI